MHSTEGFRLSLQQRNAWSLQQAAVGQPYRIVAAYSIAGELRSAEFEVSLRQVVDRHEILRTSFHRPAGIKTPFQVVAENARPFWQSFDLTDLSPPDQQKRIDECFERKRKQLFDFQQGPLLRVALLKTASAHHVLIVSLPAICADPKTLSNLIGELCDQYEHANDHAAAPNDAMQYADFAEWQHELFEEAQEQAGTEKDFWEKQQGGPRPTLPLEHRSPEPAGFVLDSVPLEIDSVTATNIEVFAREQAASVAAVLFTCWEALIWRLTGQRDFVTFNYCDGRQLADLKDACGPYAKYLPIISHCEDIPFSGLFETTHQALDQALERQEYFDPAIVARNSIDAIAFEFEERQAEFSARDLKLTLEQQYVCLQPFKLKFSRTRLATRLAVELEYDAQRFDRETIVRYAGYFQELVRNLVPVSVEGTQAAQMGSKPEGSLRRIGDIELTNDQERRQLLIEFNQTTVEFSTRRCIHQLFEDQAERTPEAIALVSGERELSYRELNERANQLAHQLLRRGVEPDDRVGLCTERGVEMIIGLLGILKAGGAYVPLNPEHPKERLALQLSESGAKILLTNTGTIDEAVSFAGETIDLEFHRDQIASEPATNPTSSVTTDNLVYVIYTSGSTGLPKGVGVTHRNLLNYTHFILGRLQIEKPLQFASVSTITADLGNTCIFPSLVSGGCLHLLSYEVAMEGELFRDYVIRRPIDVLKIVPSHLAALLATDPDGTFLPSEFLILGGEALSLDFAKRLLGINARCEIINHYGPTETTVGSLTCRVTAESLSPYSATVPIGRPIANTRAYVLDEHERPAPLGVAGQLFIGGAGVTAGYLNQPAETAARFVADPFSAEHGARLYRTGDLARVLPDGNIEFLGRVDNQVKVRGFRVELGEIEAALATHPQVRQAVVIAETPTGTATGTAAGIAGVSPASSTDPIAPLPTQRLIAYLVPATSKPPATEEVRQLVKEKLPDYMIPSVFVFLNALPLTANGKIDRAALPAPDEMRPDLQRVFVAPRTPDEQELAGIWASLLKVSEVGVYDNFFDLGGHSLLATQVVSRMRQVFKTEIPLSALFESPTVAELVERMGRRAEDETERLLRELEQLSDEEAARLLELERSASDD